MIRVILESPYAGDVEANVEYARRAVRDSLSKGEAPIASHLLYTQPGILKDEVPEERVWGIEAGLAWGCLAEKTVLYADRGISAGMKLGAARAAMEKRPTEVRFIDEPAAGKVEEAAAMVHDIYKGVWEDHKTKSWWTVLKETWNK